MAFLTFRHRFIASQIATQSGASNITLLMLHGTGGTETDLLDMGRVIAPEAALLSPRGKVLENGMSRFFRRLAEGVFDLDDLKLRTHELADFITAAADAYQFDREHMVAVGYSNGANIAASLMLSVPKMLAGAILFRPMLPLTPDVPPALADVPVLISAGQYDPIVAAAQTAQLADMLRSSGAHVTQITQPSSHALTQADVEAARVWFAEQFTVPTR